jgi:nicotinamide-nucleotide amidase
VFSLDLLTRAEALLEAYRQAGLRLVTAESCTGGLVAGCLTEIAGSSDVVERGFVTYSNAAKQEVLGVPAEVIARLGAVSADLLPARGRASAGPSRLCRRSRRGAPSLGGSGARPPVPLGPIGRSCP